MRFANRADAGRRLVDELMRLGVAARDDADVVVVGLPRGGVPVAAEVARGLHAPLDVIIVRKLGVPVQPELAMGAIGEGGTRVLDAQVLEACEVTAAQVADVEARERHELDRRASVLRAAHPKVDLTGRTVVIVDDGLATGSTARAACRVARAEGAHRVVLAVPVAPRDAAARLGADADDVVVVASPRSFHAVGQAYEDFTQTSDQQVIAALARQTG